MSKRALRSLFRKIKKTHLKLLEYSELHKQAKLDSKVFDEALYEFIAAEFTKDYEKIQGLALQKKQEETIEGWVKDKINDTYIKINSEFKKCELKNNWKKE